VLTACSSPDAGPDAASATPTASPGSPAFGSPTATPTDAPDASDTPGGPQPTRPATSAGSLEQTSLPAPGALGPLWEYYVDGGDVEGNYIGNGTPAQSRDPEEVVSALVPAGCAVESVYDVDLPRPAYVLEVAYAHPSGVQAVGLGLEFAAEAEAREFVRSYGAALADCTPPGGAPAGSVEVTVLATPTGAAGLTRIADPVEQTTWSELVVRRGAVVTILGADAASGQALPRWAAVAASL
jgi:hypothetical protein